MIAAAVPFVLYSAAVMISHMSPAERIFRNDVKALLESHPGISHKLLSAAELDALPGPLRRHLEITGFADHEKIELAAAVYKGKFALKPGSFQNIKCIQYNSLPRLTRIWYGRIYMAPFVFIDGRHLYVNGKANMLIKFGPFTVINESGKEIDQSDTLTFFNDMFLFMPSAAVNSFSTWKAVDDKSCSVTYNVNDISVSADLFFNDKGELSDYVTDDRYMLENGKSVKVRWSTPFEKYRIRGGLSEVEKGYAQWHLPQGKSPYFVIDENSDIRFYYNEEAINTYL